MTQDLTQLRADAEFVLRERENHSCGSAAWRLAAFVRDFTDPTPLTVERLVEAGGKRVSMSILWYEFEILATFPESTSWRWWYKGSRQHHPPCTVSELNQLLMRMENSHAAR